MELHQTLVKSNCTDFALTEKKDKLLVYQRESDLIHIIDGRDLESFVPHTPGGEVSESDISIIHPIELRSENPHLEGGGFIQSGKMILLKTPDGVVKQWVNSKSDFNEIDDSPEL